MVDVRCVWLGTTWLGTHLEHMDGRFFHSHSLRWISEGMGEESIHEQPILRAPERRVWVTWAGQG